MLAHSDARATEMVYVVKSTTFAVIALLGAHPFVLAAANAGTALLLLTVRGHGLRSKIVIQLNRSAGHFEALFTWLALALWWIPSLDGQITALLAITILGPLALDTLARRRLAAPAVTIVGLVLVFSIDPAQWRGLVPLVIPVIAGLVPRTLWSVSNERSFSPWAPFVDRLVLLAGVAAVIVFPLREIRPGHRASLENRVRRVHEWLACSSDATWDAPPFALFVVADSQLHALDGKRSGFHMDYVDTEVPVSVRPVELDLLSAATLRSFGAVYRELRKTRPDMLWAHLGDGADIGCISELDRFTALLPQFGLGELAAIVPGNHDVAFLGNLSWHPDWDAACPGGRSSGAYARERMGRMMSDRQGRVVSRSTTFLATATSIGALGGVDVAGVFLDTTDAPRDRVGVAGAQGGISKEQAEWVESTVAHEFPRSWIILFGHHPVDQWTPRARDHLELLARSFGSRLWAVVSAHTHLAARREHLLAGRTVPELIVGSTIDPPQEAALIEGRPGNPPAIRMRSVQAVKRPRSTCGDDLPTTDAATCQAVFQRLAESPSCAPLFRDVSPPVLEPRAGHGESPAELEAAQEARARRLLGCIGLPDIGETPLKDARLPARILSLDVAPAELVCLSWAASIMQSHKRDHWAMGQALTFALDPAATYGELEATWPADR